MGHGILKKNGRLLASMMDPVREGMMWADRICANIGKDESIIVLGLGAGYHVLELRRRLPETPILVIEPDAEVERAAQDLVLQNDTNVVENAKVATRPFSLVVESDWTKLTGHGVLGDFLGSPYRIAIHPPSRQCEPEYFANVEKLLLARDKTSFLLHLRSRPDLFSLLNEEILASLRDQGEAVSIKTLQKLFSDKAHSSRERRIWKVLEELIL